eukprot:6490591-Amphidinium_carterae.2
MYEFGEQLLYKVSSEKQPKLEPHWEIGVYVGRLAKSNETALLTLEGVAKAQASARETMVEGVYCTMQRKTLVCAWCSHQRRASSRWTLVAANKEAATHVHHQSDA